ncbi:Arc family DNA-binding protein [Streptomyces sp. NPDC008122]|uniref:Arc family DNA-binding protein n=1 Tax=Streptomyces sp. NPDC008122 TaxID=3364810 RepID=UPI0036E92FFA
MLKFTLRLPEDLHQRLTNQADIDRRSLNSEILHLLEIGLSAVSSGTPTHPDGDSVTHAPLGENGHSPQR